MDLTDFLYKFFITNLLILFLIFIFNIIWGIIKYLIVSTVCDELEHPMLTFVIIFFVPAGIFVELWRNTMIMNTKRQIYAQENEAKQTIEAIEYNQAVNRMR